MIPATWHVLEDVAKATMDFPEYREWRAWATGNPYPAKNWRKRKLTPEPGILDAVAEDEG